MDTAGALQPTPTPDEENLEAGADSAIERVLGHLHAFANAAPFTAVTLCFLAGVGAATLWNVTHRS